MRESISKCSFTFRLMWSTFIKNMKGKLYCESYSNLEDFNFFGVCQGSNFPSNHRKLHQDLISDHICSGYSCSMLAPNREHCSALVLFFSGKLALNASETLDPAFLPALKGLLPTVLLCRKQNLNCIKEVWNPSIENYKRQCTYSAAKYLPTL